MIITCDGCSTQFYLENQMLAPTGRKVQCSKCKSIWFQGYVTTPKIKFHTKSLGANKDRIFLPAVIEKKNPMLSFICIFGLFFLVLGSAFLFLYNKPGTSSVNSLVLHSFDLAHKKNDQIEINGTIENNEVPSAKVPAMTITLFDENKKLLKSIFIPAPPKYLNKGDKYSFYKMINNDFQTKPKLVSVKLSDSVEAFFYRLGSK
jgi:predicted Zn finger-like uncharacterized protein